MNPALRLPELRITWRALAVALLAGALACRRSTPAAAPGRASPLVGPVEILSAPELRRAGVVDEAALAQQVRARLLGSGVFGSLAGGAAAGRPVATTRVEVNVEEVAAAGRVAVRASIRLRIAIKPEGAAGAHFHEDVRAGAETTYVPGPASGSSDTQRRLVERAIDDLLAAYLARQRLWVGDPAVLRAVLHDGAGERRIEAIRATAARRLTAETPTLLRLLLDEDELVRDAALGALVELRERRAVAELTRSRSMRDGREMRKIVDAIATLGGREAADYLGFVADAHEDEEIRAMAQAALARLTRAQPKAE